MFTDPTVGAGKKERSPTKLTTSQIVLLLSLNYIFFTISSNYRHSPAFDETQPRSLQLLC